MKLSKSRKERLVNEVLKRKFDDKNEALNQLASSLVESLILKELSGVPYKACEKFISFTTWAYYGFGDKRSYRSGDTFSVSVNRVPDLKNINWYFSVDDNKDLMKIAKEKKTLEKNRSEAKEMLWNVMNSCNTEKQLVETVPEMQPILSSLFDSGITTSIVAVETVEKVRGLLS